MHATRSEGCDVEIRNDLTGACHIVHSPKPRGEIVESLLFTMAAHHEGEEAGPALRGCLHLFRDKLVLHFYAVPGREEEAMAELQGGAVL